MRRLLLPLLLLLLLPSVSLAAATFSVSGTDKSLEYLGSIFGPMGNLPLGPGNILLGKLIYVLNQVILALGFTIVAYTLAISTISTAQEGEVMGKKWSTIWVPTRAAAGIYLLLPSASGYCWIQIGVMWLLMQGIGAANAIWDQVLYSFITEGSITEPAPPTFGKAASTIRNILESKICEYQLNSNETHRAQLGTDEPIVLFKHGNQMIWGTESNRKAYCGTLTIPSFGVSMTLDPIVDTKESEVQRKKTIMEMAITAIDRNFANVAIEASDYGKDTWSMANEFRFASATLKTAAASTKSSEIKKEDFIDDARLDGWIHAGSYYFKLVGASLESIDQREISLPYQNPDLFEADLHTKTQAEQFENDFRSKANAYFQYAKEQLLTDVTAPSREQLGLPPGDASTALKDEASALYRASFWEFGTKIKDAALSITTRMSDKEDDPLVSIAKFGGLLVSITEAAFFGAIIGSAIVFLINSIAACTNPLWGAMQAAWAILIPFAMFMIALFWGTGITLALYVPLIPFLVFMFAAVSWMILVIEAIIASPLIALVLIVPSEDEIGKAGHALVILVGLFLRPALMVIGFVVAAKLLTVAITMVNFGFADFLLNNLGSMGIFGAVAVILIYSGIILTIVHESFSLIYLLPDKVLRWMNGTAESSDIMGKVKEAGGKVEAGAGIGKGAMKSTLAYAGSKAKGSGSGGPGGGGAFGG